MGTLTRGKRSNIIFHIIAMLTLMLVSIFGFATATTNRVVAASTPVPINMIYYGSHNDTIDNNIINSHPEFLVGNSPAGPWRGNASVSKFTSAGIKYFEYIDGGYEGTVKRSIPNDLKSNLNYIAAAAQAGAYGIFLDEVCDGIYMTIDYTYLEQIASKAHSLGLKVIFNTGMTNWADALMNYCDYINSSENWRGEALSPSQTKWASRTWLLTENVNDADTAASLTNSALNKGIRAHYACTSYGALPTWIATYVSQIGSNSSPPEPTSTGSGNTTGTVANTPTASGFANEYCFNLLITNTTASGITVGQQVWCAASITDFPNLLTLGATLTGYLDHSLGWWVFTSTNPSILPAPTNVAATDGTYPDKIQITWTNVSEATSYKVFRSTTDSSDTTVQIGTAMVSPYDDATAVVGTTYYYWVKATNASGDSAFSSSNPGWRAAVAPPTVSMEGDVNLDGYVTITDAMLITQFKAGLLILTDEQLQCADTTDDGIVSMADAMHISQWLVDPDGSLGVLFKPLWESPADDSMLQPIQK